MNQLINDDVLLQIQLKPQKVVHISFNLTRCNIKVINTLLHQ